MIQILSLRACDVLTDFGVESISHLKQLQSLDLSYCRVTDEGVLYLSTLKSLTTLLLNGTKISSRAVRSIGTALRRLRHLECGHCSGISGRDVFVYLEKLDDLHTLHLNHTNLETPLNAPNSESALANLKTLSLAHARNLRDVDVETLLCRYCTNLKSLDLTGMPLISVRGIEAIGSSM